jgi:hypothetical protein
MVQFHLFHPTFLVSGSELYAAGLKGILGIHIHTIVIPGGKLVFVRILTLHNLNIIIDISEFSYENDIT